MSLFVMYPFSLLLYNLPSSTLKHYFSILVGVAMMQWIYGPDWIHSLLSSLGTYLICLMAPRKHLHIVAFLWVMGYMTCSHAYRMYLSYLSGAFDFTATQMVLTMKLTAFAFSYYDGTSDHSKVFPEKPHADKKEAKLYEERRKYALTELPSLVEFFGFVYCFPCMLAGPTVEFTDYRAAMNGTAIVTKDKEQRERVEQSRFLPALSKLLTGVVCMVLHLALTNAFDIAQHCNPLFLKQHPNMAFRFVLLYIAMLVFRLKFYFVWKVAEGSANLAGIGFEGMDEKEQGRVKGWRGVENSDILGVELASNVQTVTRHWNKCTQKWLERYVYSRTGRSLLATYVVSALWHGLYPSFYLMFLSFPLVTSVERLIRLKINPYICPDYNSFTQQGYPWHTVVGKIYWVASIVLTLSTLISVSHVFSMGSMERSLIALGSYSFIPHCALLVVYVVLQLLPTPHTKRDEKKDK